MNIHDAKKILLKNTLVISNTDKIPPQNFLKTQYRNVAHEA